jgi:Ca2+-binding RTX toxin-like protein
MLRRILVATVATVLILPAIAMATARAAGDPDVRTGTPGDDRLRSGDGLQTLYGLGGNDHLNSGQDGDRIYGGHGDDRIWSGPDDDGTEVDRGGPGNDRLHDDDPHPTAGNDFATLYGGPGHDVCTGHSTTVFHGCEVIHISDATLAATPENG